MTARRRSSPVILAALLWPGLLFGCGAPATPTTDADWQLRVAKDEDPSEHAVRVNLVAAPSEHEIVAGHSTTFATYSGALPGPLIRAVRGDTLRVHFENRLDEATTIHWHGVRVPNDMDGVPEMSQPAVAPRGSFDYAFELPDAGLYWYHPHQDSVAQLGAGLYGALLVRDPNEPSDLGDEVVLILSDASLDENAKLVPPSTDSDSMLAGNEGNVLLVNGRRYPTLPATSGRRQRWRILNAARSRYFELGLEGHSFVRIGSDGGLDEYPVTLEHPLLSPGERLDLLVTPNGSVGTSLDLISRAHSRGLPLPYSEPQALLKLAFVDAQPNTEQLPTLTSAIQAIDTKDAERISIALTIGSTDGSVEMGINDVPFAEAEPLHARVGTSQVLVIDNKSPYSHPFHLHGFFFQPLDEAGTPQHPLVAKDTIDIPPLSRQLLGVHYDDRPGMWMFHCHILDHAEGGMMGTIHLMH